MAIKYFIGEKDGGLLFATDTGQQEFLLDTPETRELAGRLGGPDLRTAQVVDPATGMGDAGTIRRLLNNPQAGVPDAQPGAFSYGSAVTAAPAPATDRGQVESLLQQAGVEPQAPVASPGLTVSQRGRIAQLQGMQADEEGDIAAAAAAADLPPEPQGIPIDPLTGRPLIRTPGVAGRAAGYRIRPGSAPKPIFSEKVQRAEDDLLEQARDAQTDAYLAQEQELFNQEAVRSGQAKANEEAIKRETERLERVETEATRLRSETEERRQALDKAQLDPKKLWKDNSTFMKIIFSMAIAIGEGDEEQGNSALDAWQLAVDRDIDAQKFNILQEEKGLGDANNALSELYRSHGNMQAAEKELRGLHAQATALELQKLTLDSGNAKANAALTNAQMQITAQAIELEKSREAAAREGLGYDPGQAGVAPGVRGMTNEELQQLVKGRELTAEAVPGATQVPMQGRALRFGGQFIGNAQTKEEGVKLRVQLADMEALDELMTELIDMRENWGKMSLEQRNQAKSSSTFAKMAAKGDAGFALGVLAGPDMELIEMTIPGDPNAVMEPGQTALLKQTRLNFRRKGQKLISKQGPNIVLPWLADEVQSDR